MLRRCPAPLIVLTAALAFGLGSQPMSSRADGLTSSSDTSNTPTVTLDYTLTTSQAIAPVSGSPPTQSSTNPPTPQVLATDSPISIVPPPSGSSTGPLQIVSDSSGYYFNNPSELIVGVGNTTMNGSPVPQALGLTFYGQGLAAGNSLTFSLTFDKAIVDGNPPQIPQFTVLNPTTLAADDVPIQIKYDGVATRRHRPRRPSRTAPEPLSLLVWSALAGVGMWRVRGRRRRAALRR